jgi:hypothetical protein
MPTLAEQWLEQGRKEGLVLGLEKDRKEGQEVETLAEFEAALTATSSASTPDNP